MKDDVLQRIKWIYEQKSISEREFANYVGINPKTINQQFKGERSLSLDVVLGVISSFEDISTEWLLRGKGDIILTDEASKIKSLEAECNQLLGENRALREMLGMKEKDSSSKSA